MKKKLLTLVAVVATLALACVLAGCQSNSGSSSSSSSSNSGSSSSSSESSSSSSATTASDGFKLIVGFDQSYPPYGFVGDDGDYTGFDLDLAKAVCEKKGWDLELQAIDWDAKDALLSQGNINCIWNGFTMEGREDNYTFSDPYMLNKQVVVVKNNSDISALSDLAQKTVITQVDSAALEVLEGDMAELSASFSGGAAQTIADYNNAFMQLQSGMVDAVACDLSIAQYQMAQNPNQHVMLDEPLSSENYAVGFKKGETDLAKQVTETLKELDQEGTVKELCEKYADYGLSYDNWVL